MPRFWVFVVMALLIGASAYSAPKQKAAKSRPAAATRTVVLDVTGMH